MSTTLNYNQKTSLTMVLRGLITINGSVTSTELKKEVDKIGINKQFPNNEFTDNEASTFLKEYRENNSKNIQKRYVKEGSKSFITFEFLKEERFNLINGKYSCYNVNDKKQFVQSNSKAQAITNLKKEFGVKDSAIRICSSTYFSKKHL